MPLHLFLCLVHGLKPWEYNFEHINLFEANLELNSNSGPSYYKVLTLTILPSCFSLSPPCSSVLKILLFPELCYLLIALWLSFDIFWIAMGLVFKCYSKIGVFENKNYFHHFENQTCPIFRSPLLMLVQELWYSIVKLHIQSFINYLCAVKYVGKLPLYTDPWTWELWQ